MEEIRLDEEFYVKYIIPFYTRCFTDKEIRNHCEYVSEDGKNVRGKERPLYWAGGFGIVFLFQNPLIKKKYAIKCFFDTYAKSSELHKKYQQVCEYFKNKKTELPFLVDCEFLEKGISVEKKCYPILKMEFVENSKKLNEYLEDIINEKEKIKGLIENFISMILSLQKNGIAHGDIQHGNILVIPNGELRLIDYDGVYISTMQNIKQTESGLPAYQHPERHNLEYVNDKIDNFSALVILTTLKAYYSHPNLWKDFPPGDFHLFFEGEDFQDPEESLRFKTLLNSRDEEVKRLALILKESCMRSYEQIPEFKDVINPDFTVEKYIQRYGILKKPQPPIFISPSQGEKISSLRPILEVKPIDNSCKFHFRIFEKSGKLIIEKFVNTNLWNVDSDLENGKSYECDCRVKIGRIWSEFSPRQNFTIFLPIKISQKSGVKTTKKFISNIPSYATSKRKVSIRKTKKIVSKYLLNLLKWFIFFISIIFLIRYINIQNNRKQALINAKIKQEIGSLSEKDIYNPYMEKEIVLKTKKGDVIIKLFHTNFPEGINKLLKKIYNGEFDGARIEGRYGNDNSRFYKYIITSVSGYEKRNKKGSKRVVNAERKLVLVPVQGSDEFPLGVLRIGCPHGILNPFRSPGAEERDIIGEVIKGYEILKKYEGKVNKIYIRKKTDTQMKDKEIASKKGDFSTKIFTSKTEYQWKEKNEIVLMKESKQQDINEGFILDSLTLTINIDTLQKENQNNISSELYYKNCPYCGRGRILYKAVCPYCSFEYKCPRCGRQRTFKENVCSYCGYAYKKKH